MREHTIPYISKPVFPIIFSPGRPRHEIPPLTIAVFDLDTFTWIRRIPNLVIGSASDNNTPPNPVSGDNAWANGGYYFGVVYTNTTYNMSLFHYIEFTVEGF
ncbi:hypothetical protein DN748_12145 [Sinomicrobium soli]|nr:hypothetical protein DN748_12145 [Sinomicrobium sp. N-1-3-6]